jgi:hypothetical protein
MTNLVKSPNGEVLKIIDGKCYAGTMSSPKSFSTASGVTISDTMAASSINFFEWDGV